MRSPMTERASAGLFLAATLLLLAAASVRAEIQDYMIRRLLYLSTSCGVQKLVRLEAGNPEWRRFKADCRDVNAYPHGIFITCMDIADDRSCKIETPSKSFDSLELMRPKGD
jgi:hypothetical protein